MQNICEQAKSSPVGLSCWPASLCDTPTDAGGGLDRSLHVSFRPPSSDNVLDYVEKEFDALCMKFADKKDVIASLDELSNFADHPFSCFIFEKANASLPSKPACFYVTMATSPSPVEGRSNMAISHQIKKEKILDERNHGWVAKFLIFVWYKIAILIPFSENGRLLRDRSRRKKSLPICALR
jgi:hypothetical protein